MKINKKYATGIILAILILSLSNYVYAFSVGCAYHKDNPLRLYPGQSTDITFSLQNMGSDEDIIAQSNILQGSRLMALLETGTFIIPTGGEKIVNARVTLPTDAKIGDTYIVEIEFSTVTDREKGTFEFGSAVGRKFNVEVVPEPTPTELPEEPPVSPSLIATLLIITPIIVIIIIVTVITIVIKKRKFTRKK